MLIITADDYGKTVQATDRILECFSCGRITSTSAMVFMEDSERSAALSLQTEMEIGLHLNFTTPFSSDKISQRFRECHDRVISYLTSNKLAVIIYNPLLAGTFNYLFNLQKFEFIRLYGRPPDFYNGHHHMHLCANMLAGSIIPNGSRVRRSFTFDRGEKNPFNRFYRHILDKSVSNKFISTDSFFSIVTNHTERLENIFSRAVENTVEIEVHPENNEELNLLLSTQYQYMLDLVHIGKFADLDKKSE